MAHGRAVLRLLLLAVILTGVAGMHTLGHPAGADHRLPAVQPLFLMNHEPIAAGMSAPAGSEHIDVHDLGMRLDPRQVCLATLVGSLALLLAAMGVATSRRWASTDRSTPAATIAGRGPPTWAPRGLLLADLSVART